MGSCNELISCVSWIPMLVCCGLPLDVAISRLDESLSVRQFGYFSSIYSRRCILASYFGGPLAQYCMQRDVEIL